VSSRTATYNRDGRQGYPNRIETNPWNLIRFRPAEGARRSSPDPAPDAVLIAIESPMIDFAAAYPNSKKAYEERGSGARGARRIGDAAGSDARGRAERR
jgi:hypothetical protein